MAKTPDYEFFLNPTTVPHHLVPDRRQIEEDRLHVDETRRDIAELRKSDAELRGRVEELEAVNKARGDRPYVLRDWAEPYLKRVAYLRNTHPHLYVGKRKKKKIEREIRDRITREEDPPIDGLPVGDGLIDKAMKMMRKAGRL